MMELPKNQSILIKIRQTFAKSNEIPRVFAAKAILQTEKAAYLYGHGTTESVKTGVCMICGRKLTHPVSVKYGIGPECGGHYHIPMNEGDDIPEKIQQNMRVNQWVPKSCIEETWDCGTEVHIPKDHPMLKNRKQEKQSRAAIQVQYKDSGKKGIKITFPFNYEDLANVKTLSGRRFHNEGASKYWTAPLTIENAEALQSWGFELDQNILDFINKSKISINDVDDDINIPGLQMDLFPYQKRGVSFIEAKEGRALIGDEMGLGKTAQALAWLQLHPEKRPAIVICPASLKLNWEKEARMWMDNPNIQILSGKKTGIPIVGDIIIINYDILPTWIPKLKSINPEVLITDECHYFKNNQAKRTKAVKALGKSIPHVICLSGTPIVNRPIEGFNAINLIDSSVIGSNFFSFAKKYCDAKHNGFGWDFNGASNTDELHYKLTNSIMIRRKKADVLKDLPPKIRSFVPMELTKSWQKEYSKAEADLIAWIKERKGNKAAKKASNAEALARIENLKQIAVKGKINSAINWIKDHLDGNGKLVVFCTHAEAINQLQEELKDYNPVKVDGSVSQENRNKAVEKFQEDDSCRLFLGNIKAAGVGLTLTAANSTAFLELGWSPGDHDQAEDRVHRIGQEADSVNAYYLLAQGTIEEEIAGLIDKKRKILDQVLDGQETDESSLLGELMQAYS